MLLSKYNFYNFALPPIVEYYTKLTSFNIHFLGVNTNFAFYSLGVVYTKFVYRTLSASFSEKYDFLIMYLQN